MRTLKASWRPLMGHLICQAPPHPHSQLTATQLEGGGGGSGAGPQLSKKNSAAVMDDRTADRSTVTEFRSSKLYVKQMGLLCEKVGVSRSQVKKVKPEPMGQVSTGCCLQQKSWTFNVFASLQLMSTFKRRRCLSLWLINHEPSWFLVSDLINEEKLPRDTLSHSDLIHTYLSVTDCVILNESM